jgi:Tfp pilus assembly protein PilN
LLSERLVERDHLADKSRRKLVSIALTLVGIGIVLPPIHGLMQKETASATAAQERSKQLAATLATLERERDSYKPRVAIDEMRKTCLSYAENFLGQTSFVLNAVPPSVALQTIRTAVTGGEIKINGQAEAEDYASARTFVDAAGKGPNVEDMLMASTRRSDTLGTAGVAFDFSKRVRAGS